MCCSFEISQYITKHFALDAAAQKAEPGHGLKVAGSTGERRQEDGIGIVLTTDKDEETVRRERDEEAAAKRQQNVMPAWHLKSTISGDLTALGIKENAQSATSAQVVSPTSLDESLKGLGVVRTTSLKAQATAEEADDDDDDDDDDKPDEKEGNEADCERAHLSASRDPTLTLFYINPYTFYCRLRPVLRVLGSFGRAVDATHAVGRVLRPGRLRRGQEAEHRVPRLSQRAQQALEIDRERRRRRTKAGQGERRRQRMGSGSGSAGTRTRTREWGTAAPSREWRGKCGTECGGRSGGRGRSQRIWSVFFSFFG